MARVLITGCSGGLGLEFAKQYAEAGWDVFACSRNPMKAQELLRLAARQRQLSLNKLDPTDFKLLDKSIEKIPAESLDLVIANAGIYGPRTGTLESVKDTDWMEALSVNLMAPLLLARGLQSHLSAASGKFVVISSKMGSIADNARGGQYIYRSSKAGLNAAARSLALDWQAASIPVGMLHPGWVRTNMGGEKADIAVEESVTGMRLVIDQLNMENSGGFWDYQGKTLPW